MNITRKLLVLVVALCSVLLLTASATPTLELRQGFGFYPAEPGGTIYGVAARLSRPTEMETFTNSATIVGATGWESGTGFIEAGWVGSGLFGNHQYPYAKACPPGSGTCTRFVGPELPWGTEAHFLVLRSSVCSTCWSAFMYLDEVTYILLLDVDTEVSYYSYAAAGYEGINHPSPWDASNITRFAFRTTPDGEWTQLCYSWTFATEGVLVGSCYNYPPLGHWWNVIVYP